MDSHPPGQVPFAIANKIRGTNGYPPQHLGKAHRSVGQISLLGWLYQFVLQINEPIQRHGFKISRILAQCTYAARAPHQSQISRRVGPVRNQVPVSDVEDFHWRACMTIRGYSQIGLVKPGKQKGY